MTLDAPSGPVARPRAAEFFAGIGLVRTALEGTGFDVVWANDIEPAKRSMYAANHPSHDFVLGDVCDVEGSDLPDVDVATASFPCTDLSLAGNRAGLQGEQSSMFWEFARVLDEMDERRPQAVLLENVPSFATSHHGDDLRAAIQRLNELGYVCDLLVLDAKHFVPQSRPRLFIVGDRSSGLADTNSADSDTRPAWIHRFIQDHPQLELRTAKLPSLPVRKGDLSSVVQRLPRTDPRWWDAERVSRFESSLSEIQRKRLERLRKGRRLSWSTAYRRTRYGKATWEIRADSISGCLRTARGGSSKQALVEAGRGSIRIRWMTPSEYAGLQGVPGYRTSGVSDNQALFGFGDAVCVPVVQWLAANYVKPLISGSSEADADRLEAVCA